MNNTITTVSLVAAAAICAGASSAHAQATAGRIAPDFTTTDLETGATVRLSDYAGEVVVLKFFAFW